MDDNDLGNFGSDPYEFGNVIGDGDQPLYPNCSKYTKLSALVKLYNLKAKHGMSDVYFTKLLILQGELLPEGNTIPSSMYEAKKTLCALGLSYEKIYACPNDCILYRKEYEHSTHCPTCGISRWKEGKDSILKEGVPSKDEIKGVYDAHLGEYFTLRATLLWTINDFPAYGNLSSCIIKGYKACPICGDDTPSHGLKNGHKICYIGHRKWLPRYYPY
ncbi:unnamed protein product [Prunus armeniaca]